MLQKADSIKAEPSPGTRIRIAVQKSGRLSGPTTELLRLSGIEIEPENKKLMQRSTGFPADILFVRDDDIPAYISNDACDLGILGLNEFMEKTAEAPRELKIIKKLGFSKCRLSLATQEGSDIKNLSDLSGKKIATSYPRVLRQFLNDQKIDCQIVDMQGSVEIAPSIGIADLICDLVSTGSTLRSNNLREFYTVMESEAVLVGKKNSAPSLKRSIETKLFARIRAIYNARTARYIMMNAPKDSVADITRIIPGLNYPTVMPLSSGNSMVAIHAVAEEPVFWNTIEKLKEAGARSIIVSPIEKLVD